VLRRASPGHMPRLHQVRLLEEPLTDEEADVLRSSAVRLITEVSGGARPPGLGLVFRV
jgi:hypothetical protein